MTKKAMELSAIISILILIVGCSEAAEEVGRDGTFVAYSTGVVYDKNTGLEWLAGPDRDTTWDEAKSWVANLTVAGGGWRMPTMEEVRTLYHEGAGSRNMTPLFETTGWWVWSGETYMTYDGLVWAFGFGKGGGSDGSPSRTSSIEGRVFAVRSRR